MQMNSLIDSGDSEPAAEIIFICNDIELQVAHTVRLHVRLVQSAVIGANVRILTVLVFWVVWQMAQQLMQQLVQCDWLF